jgi:hypothetical protein
MCAADVMSYRCIASLLLMCREVAVHLSAALQHCQLLMHLLPDAVARAAHTLPLGGTALGNGASSTWHAVHHLVVPLMQGVAELLLPAPILGVVDAVQSMVPSFDSTG